MHSGCRPSQGRARFSLAVHCLQVHSCSTDAPPPSKPPSARGNCCCTGTPCRPTSACRQHCRPRRPMICLSRRAGLPTPTSSTAPPHAMRLRRRPPSRAMPPRHASSRRAPRSVSAPHLSRARACHRSSVRRSIILAPSAKPATRPDLLPSLLSRIRSAGLFLPPPHPASPLRRTLRAEPMEGSDEARSGLGAPDSARS